MEVAMNGLDHLLWMLAALQELWLTQMQAVWLPIVPKMWELQQRMHTLSPIQPLLELGASHRRMKLSTTMPQEQLGQELPS